LLTNASIVYALNLYALCTTNPLAVIFAASTIMPSLDFYYNGMVSWWERWKKWIALGILVLVGIIATAVACYYSGPFGGAATATTVITALGQIAKETAKGVIIALIIGGTIVGVQGALTGQGFWQSFGESVQNNFAEALVMSFAFASVHTAIGNIIQHSVCFKEGTLVETEDGLKPIEEIEVGDKVLAYDEETGEQAYKEVVRLFRNETNEWYHIYANGEEIICTGGHPFYVANLDKFIPARELKVGEKLLLSSGVCVTIETIQIEQLSEPETTYNFEVADFHTYYVTDSKVLVHNKCLQEHHYLTNKNQEYTPKMKEITDKYNLDLDGSWNKELLTHGGRHAKAYHEYMLEGIKNIDKVAQGNVDVFLKQFEILKSTVRANPGMMYKAFWIARGVV